jgi:hypothetical protein
MCRTQCARYQAKTPLIILRGFPGPALSSRREIEPDHADHWILAMIRRSVPVLTKLEISEHRTSNSPLCMYAPSNGRLILIRHYRSHESKRHLMFEPAAL